MIVDPEVNLDVLYAEERVEHGEEVAPHEVVVDPPLRTYTPFVTEESASHSIGQTLPEARSQLCWEYELEEEE